MTSCDGNRAEFIATVRRALGRGNALAPDAPPAGIRHPRPESAARNALLDHLASDC